MLPCCIFWLIKNNFAWTKWGMFYPGQVQPSSGVFTSDTASLKIVLFWCLLKPAMSIELKLSNAIAVIININIMCQKIYVYPITYSQRKFIKAKDGKNISSWALTWTVLLFRLSENKKIMAVNWLVDEEELLQLSFTYFNWGRFTLAWYRAL